MNTPTPLAKPVPSEASAHGPAHQVALSKPLLLGLATALALTFWLYAQADVVIILADQLWACF